MDCDEPESSGGYRGVHGLRQPVAQMMSSTYPHAVALAVSVAITIGHAGAIIVPGILCIGRWVERTDTSSESEMD